MADTILAHRHDKYHGYRLPFLSVVQNLNAFWQRAFDAIGLRYRAPSVRTLEGAVMTACGPARPAHLAFYCPTEEAIYYAPIGLDEHHRRIGDFAPRRTLVVRAPENRPVAASKVAELLP